MTLLVDTSVWSLLFRRGDPSTEPVVVLLLDAVQSDADVVLTGAILQEILQAFRTPTAFRRVSTYLAAFPLLPVDRAHFVAAARLHRRCASKGIAASTIDCQIAQAAVDFSCELLTADKDFQRIAGVSRLRLAGRPV